MAGVLQGREGLGTSQCGWAGGSHELPPAAAQVLGLLPGNDNIFVSAEEIWPARQFLQGSRICPLKEQYCGWLKRKEQNLLTLLLHLKVSY